MVKYINAKGLDFYLFGKSLYSILRGDRTARIGLTAMTSPEAVARPRITS